ncbi:hypothetical protein [Moritella viscosa]|uniref:hypothetical protein n=1 Tax=Moritella viscosa TaxID=80854 RepID=UPI0009167114|nr:hypothetical protein [Moritella viscosa]SGY88166.1 Putative uncharacterized protein [Moritella viscosa]
MQRLILVLLFSCLSSASFANVDITEACNEYNEQKESLFELSTSILEAHLVGQCIGYENTSRYRTFDELPRACYEFLEQKNALLPNDMSTSLAEATLSGMCIGAIYKIKTLYFEQYYRVDYVYVASHIHNKNKRDALRFIKRYFE